MKVKYHKLYALLLGFCFIFSFLLLIDYLLPILHIKHISNLAPLDNLHINTQFGQLIKNPYAVTEKPISQDDCSGMDYRQSYPYGENWVNFYYKNKSFLSLPKPGSYHAILKKNQKILYDVKYTFDKFSRRKVFTNYDCHNKNDLLLLGNSFIFGEGNNDGQTVADFLENPKYCVHNYSFQGFGIDSLYMRILTTNFYKQIHHSENMAIFFFFYWDIRKMLRTVQFEAKPIFREIPYLDIDLKSKTITPYKNLFDYSPLRSLSYQLLGKLNFFEQLNVDYPPITDTALKKFAFVLAKMKKLLARKAGVTKFYVIPYPQEWQVALFDRLIPYLEYYKIPYIYFRTWDLPRLLGDNAFYSCDLHPKQQAQKYFATMLKQYVLIK